MQFVVCDANVLFAGLIDPDSLYRKLLAVFAYGKLHAEARAAEGERAEIEQLLAENPGSELVGQDDADEIGTHANRRIALMEEYLPAMTPKDWGLVTSPYLTNEVYENAISSRSEKLGGQTQEAARAAVAAAVAISTHHVISGLDGAIPPYTEGRDLDDDPVIHTAILAQAPWVLSQDKKHISLDHRRPTPYTDPTSGRQTGAITLGYFISRLLCTGLHFDEADLKSIAGDAALRRAIEPLDP